MSAPQYERMSNEDAIQRLFTMVNDMQAALREMHGLVASQQENIRALDQKLEGHVRDEAAHCERRRPELEPIQPYHVRNYNY